MSRRLREGHSLSCANSGGRGPQGWAARRRSLKGETLVSRPRPAPPPLGHCCRRLWSRMGPGPGRPGDKPAGLPHGPRRPPTTPDDPHRPLPTPARPGPRALRPGGRLLTRPPCLTELQELEGGGGPVRPPPHRPRPGLRQERAAHQPHRGLAAGGPRGGGAWREHDPISRLCPPCRAPPVSSGRCRPAPGARSRGAGLAGWRVRAHPAQRRDTRGPRGTRASPAAAAPSIRASGVTPRRPHGSRAGRAAEPRSGPLPRPPVTGDPPSLPRPALPRPAAGSGLRVPTPFVL